MCGLSIHMGKRHSLHLHINAKFEENLKKARQIPEHSFSIFFSSLFYSKQEKIKHVLVYGLNILQ